MSDDQGWGLIVARVEQHAPDCEDAAGEARAASEELGEHLRLIEVVTSSSMASESFRQALAEATDLVGEVAAQFATAAEQMRQYVGSPDSSGSPPTGDPSARAERAIDRLPSPVLTDPQPIPPHVTNDPSTWPGRIRQDHVEPKHRFSDDEELVARRLAMTWPDDIEPIPRSQDRTADARVNGKPVEFKTLRAELADHRTVKAALNNATSSGGQSSDVIVDARRVPLSPGDAIKGIARFLNAPGNDGKLTRVRIWGSDFDLDWKAHG